MALPIVSCPCCNVELPLEAWIAHQAMRDAFVSLASLHPSMRLPWATFRYVGLFAPPKRKLRPERIADLFEEVRVMVSSGTVDWQHNTLPAPLDYWINAMDTLCAKDDLRRPLSSHNLLRAVVASYSEQAKASAERERITSGRGETPVAPAPRRPTTDAGALKDTGPADHKAAGATRPREAAKSGLQSLKAVLSCAAIPSPTQEKTHG